MTRYDTISCFTDLGRVDESVGVVHSILRETSPGTHVVDLCHDIGPGDARGASLMIARSVPYLAPGVVLASVGASLERPAVAVEVGDGQAALIGPDSGVLASAVAVVGGAGRAVRLTNEDLHFASPGALHPARDVLAPCAGHLAAGMPFEELGEPIDPALLLPSLMPVPRLEDDGSLATEVLGVDLRGAAQLNIDREALGSIEGLDGDNAILVLAWGDEQRVIKLADGPAPAGGVAMGQLALAEDVHGLLAIMSGEGASHLGLATGTEVQIRAAR